MMKRKWIFVLGSILVMLGMTGCGNKHINLNDYYTYETQGTTIMGKSVNILMKQHS